MQIRNDYPLDFSLEDYRFQLNKRGSDHYAKVSYPLFCGLYSEIQTPDCTFHFNLNQELIRLIGKGDSWPHPQEWLKRTVGNDWIYYSTGGYTGVFETTGEYYLPNLPYPTNKFLGGNPFDNSLIHDLTANWPARLEEARSRLREAPPEVVAFFGQVAANSPEVLADKGAALYQVCENCTSVLPPDARHVDYNVIPVNIARGCLHKCRFCRVKNSHPFRSKSRAEIDSQLDQLQHLYAKDLVNYNAVFLGEHDGLQADPGIILYSISRAQERLGLTESAIKGTNIFIFGSVISFLDAPQSLFQELENVPGSVYINVGLESADQATLDILGKPLRREQVIKAFERMQAINETFRTIEITANFVIGDNLGQSHYEALLELIGQRVDRTRSKGCVYLSPLDENEVSRARLFDFYRYKVTSRLPLYLYMIQRL